MKLMLCKVSELPKWTCKTSAHDLKTVGYFLLKFACTPWFLEITCQLSLIAAV